MLLNIVKRLFLNYSLNLLIFISFQYFKYSHLFLSRLKIVKISFKCKQFFIQLRKELVSIDLIIININKVLRNDDISELLVRVKLFLILLITTFILCIFLFITSVDSAR